jgi:alcohol dehydrogenase class IV
MTFSIVTPPRILFGRGERVKAAGVALAFGARGVVVHGSGKARAAELLVGLPGALTISCASEPTLEMLEAAIAIARPHAPEWVLAIGGGAVLDMGKALAGLIPQVTTAMDHLEGVGPALPLAMAPLPFIAIPTTAGTGAEATKNAVIAVPGRKVSLRDDRMMARVAIVDPALMDGCPRAVTLASGLDAITQVVEPYVSCKANAYTDALTLPAIGQGLGALMRVMAGEDAAARDVMAWVSLTGGIALANAGLGAVHGFAGVIGGMTGAAHGAICGVLLPHVVAMNRMRVADRARLDQVCAIIGAALGVAADDAPTALARWARAQGLPTLTELGLKAADRAMVAQLAQSASSMKGNPVALSTDDLRDVLKAAG